MIFKLEWLQRTKNYHFDKKKKKNEGNYIWLKILGSGKSPGEWNGNPLQYSCLENPMDGEAW